MPNSIESIETRVNNEAGALEVLGMLGKSAEDVVRCDLNRKVASIACDILDLPLSYQKLLESITKIKIDEYNSMLARDNADLRQRIIELESVKAYVACELDIDNSDDLRVFQIDVNIAVNIMSGAAHE